MLYRDMYILPTFDLSVCLSLFVPCVKIQIVFEELKYLLVRINLLNFWATQKEVNRLSDNDL